MAIVELNIKQKSLITNDFYKAFLSNDLINLFDELFNYIEPKTRFNKDFNYSKLHFDNSKGIKSYLISGTIKDNKYLNPLHKRHNDKFFNHDNDFIYCFNRSKNYKLGFNSFLEFIKPFVNQKNFNDYYDRFKDFNTLSLAQNLNLTFKDKQVFKINLSDIELEKLNKTYLFYSNGLKTNQYRVTFMFIDEFLFNVKIKPNRLIYNELNYKKFIKQNYKNKSLLNDLILIVEKLGTDNKNTFIYCNKRSYRVILQSIACNNVKWYKSSTDKLLKLISKYSYSYNDFDEQYKDLIKSLKDNKNRYAKLDKKADWYKKELDLMIKSNRTNNNRFKKLDSKFNDILYQMNDLELNLIDINQDLIEFDIKQDKFLNNLLDENKNYSFKLKSYL